jgi:hypothetical protein
VNLWEVGFEPVTGTGEFFQGCSQHNLEFATDTGSAGGFIFDENPNHATDGWRYLEAAPFDQSAGAHWGCFRTPIEGGSRHGGTGEQNTRDMLKGCPEPGTAAGCAPISVSTACAGGSCRRETSLR